MGPVSTILSLPPEPNAGNPVIRFDEAKPPKFDMARTRLTLNSVGLAILRRCLLPSHPLPYRLPIQATEGQLHHSNLSPKHQLQRLHLFRHPP
jgi:hypothetical protein